MYSKKEQGLSFELYPPKSEAGEWELFDNFRELAAYNPAYVTCTYGAGGGTRNKTLAILSKVKSEFNLPVSAHLTCVGSTKDELRSYLAEACERGIDAIVALRGDPPEGEESFQAVEGGLAYANELVAFIRAEFPDLGIAVAGYPETHPEAKSRATDLDNLKRKIDAGSDIVITQLFYDTEDFYRFRDSCETMGIEAPIIPGILPVTNLKQIKRVTALCGAALPNELLSRLEVHAENAQGQFDVGVYHATRQVEELVSRGGCPGVHFYCLNKSRAVATILRALTLSFEPVHDRAHSKTKSV